MLTIVRFGDLWVIKVGVGFLQQLDLKNKKIIHKYSCIIIRHASVDKLGKLNFAKSHVH